DVVIKHECRSRYAKYSILNILTAEFPSLRNRKTNFVNLEMSQVFLNLIFKIIHINLQDKLPPIMMLVKRPYCVFQKNEKYRPYKIHLVQELNDDDPDRRLEFCEIMANRCQDNPLFIKKHYFF
ncbi:hypothetical protein NQ318_014507, partial [Aromia moschata]